MSNLISSPRLAAMLLRIVLIGWPLAALADIELSINIAPPPLPVYEQPPVPSEGYLWTPGYWMYGPEGYFWVPGTWVEPPQRGLVWTPGYWGWSNDLYVWNGGYWGPNVGFYGGVNYGYGYSGRGYEGGYWRGDDFFYNRAVNNVRGPEIRNVYSKTVINNITVNNISYNGGAGGVAARPTAQEQTASGQPHRPPTTLQTEHRATAASHPELLASANHGKPPIAATPKPNEFAARGVAAGSAGTAHEAVASAPDRGTSAQAVQSQALPKPSSSAPASNAGTGRSADNQRPQADLQSKNDSKSEAAQRKQVQEADMLKQGNGTSAMASDQLEKQHQQQQMQTPSQTRLAEAPRPEQAPRAGNGNANGTADRAVASTGAGAMTQAAPRAAGSNALQPEDNAKTSAAQQKQTQEAGRLKPGSPGGGVAPTAHQQPQMQPPPQPRPAAAQRSDQAPQQRPPTQPKQNGTGEDSRKTEDNRKEPQH